MDRKGMACSFFKSADLKKLALFLSQEKFSFSCYMIKKREKHSGGKMAPVYNMNSWI